MPCTSKNMPIRAAGFSLVELSIVLVILGLLVGGILSGKSLIRASELRSVLKDIENFDTAVGSFKSKYFQLPSDMNNAKSFWPTDCLDDLPNSQTCNGNGNGQIDILTGSRENLRFWQHLSLAELISGSYNAINTRASDYDSLSVSFSKDFTPQSRISNAYFVPDHDITGTYSGFPPTQLKAAKQYVMTFGFITDTVVNTGAVLRAAEVYNLDIKSDDGLPDKGWLKANNGLDSAFNPIAPGCVVVIAMVSSYRLNSSEITCSLFYLR
jgi:prepilin-type N-terminal cleavage/methylation domain-containing protein